MFFISFPLFAFLILFTLIPFVLHFICRKTLLCVHDEFRNDYHLGSNLKMGSACKDCYFIFVHELAESPTRTEDNMTCCGRRVSSQRIHIEQSNRHPMLLEVALNHRIITGKGGLSGSVTKIFGTEIPDCTR